MTDAAEEVVAGEQCLGRLDYENAYKHFDRALKLDPNNASAYFGKAEASLGMPSIAPEPIASLYKKAIELDPRNPQFHEAYASFCMDLGRFNEAELSFLKAAELDQENAPFYYADFAVSYYYKAPMVMERFLDDKTKDIIARKSLSYVLKALKMEKEEAKRLLI